MMSSKSSTPLRDALYAFSLAQSVPDAALLDEFVRRFPEHAAELTDFAIEVAIDAARGDDDAAAKAIEPRVSPAVSRAMSRFQNRMFAVRRSDEAASKQSLASSAAAVNPFIALDRTAFRALTTRLHANTVFVAKLRDRQIDPETMPSGFLQRVASEMNVSPEVLDTHFSAPSEHESPQYLKAEQKPEADARQSFEDAVRSSGLTEEQQRYLLGF